MPKKSMGRFLFDLKENIAQEQEPLFSYSVSPNLASACICSDNWPLLALWITRNTHTLEFYLLKMNIIRQSIQKKVVCVFMVKLHSHCSTIYPLLYCSNAGSMSIPEYEVWSSNENKKSGSTLFWLRCRCRCIMIVDTGSVNMAHKKS